MNNSLRHITTIVAILIIFLSNSCVENSKQYKELQAQLDSLQGSYGNQKNQLDNLFASLNEIENGLEDIRKTENILTIESQEGDLTADHKEKMSRNIEAIKLAISNYQQKIEELKNDNNLKSVEFKKRLNQLQNQLNEKSATIEKLSKEIAHKEAIIQEKDETIAQLDNTVATLKEDIEGLSEENTQMKGEIEGQDKEIHSVYYTVGTKDELIKAGILTKAGLFSSSKLTYQGDKSAFIKIDYREISAINTNSPKAKVLSVHPQDSYSIDVIEGQALITISNPEKFWDQTKHLVVQTQ